MSTTDLTQQIATIDQQMADIEQQFVQLRDQRVQLAQQLAMPVAFAVYAQNTGRIDRVISCPRQVAEASCAAGEALLEAPADVRDDTHYVDTAAQAFVAFPPRPAAHYTWDWATHAWGVTLQVAQAAKWEEMKAARTAQEYGGFMAVGLQFDSDPDAIQRVTGAVTMALVAQQKGEAFSIDWTLADNSVATLVGDDMVNVGLALGQHVSAAHAHARALRAQIEAAGTVAEVEAIGW